jgi:outer membrane protein assembly factor BamA
MCNKVLLILIVGLSCSLSSLQAQIALSPEDSIPPADSFTRIKNYLPGFDTIQPVSGTPFLISSIVVTGNKKTKSTILLREAPFKAGMNYSLAELIDQFQRGEQQLMNTTLFHTVRIYASKFEGNCLEVTIAVAERWYLFPFPFFSLVDRNFNQWLVEHNASLQRVNYGLKLLYNNPTGHNDRMRLWLINGYTKELSMSYERPYFDRKMRWGYGIIMRTGKTREVNFNTASDKQLFFRSDNFIRWYSSAGGELIYRPKLYARHSIGLYYYQEKVNDTVTHLNPDYFGTTKNVIRFPDLFYQFSYVKMDYLPYPSKGLATRIKFSKLGLTPSFNLWQLHWKTVAAFPIGVKNIFTTETYAGLKLPFNQPYINRRFLGYKDIFMRGFEYNVVDGVAGGYVRAQFAREIARINIVLPGFIRKRATITSIPFRLFAKVYSNAGYVYSPTTMNNQLQNRFLQASGIGIDVLSLYDLTIRIEYSFNNLGQNGLFLHRTSNF